MKQRAIDETRRLGLPVLRAGMSHNAVAVELRRAVRRMEVRDSILKAWQDERQGTATPPAQPHQDAAERAARTLLNALDSGGSQQRHAEAFLKTAPAPIKEKILELAGTSSPWKQPRSNGRNDF